MSNVSLHVFVEGKRTDKYVYGSMYRAELADGLKYTLHRAEEVSTTGVGGKQALLSLFDELKASGLLADEFQGHCYASLFFLDKDIDDITGGRRRSKHIVYTRAYDIEGEIFVNANIIEGAAAAFSEDPGEVEKILPNDHLWCLKTAHLWMDWVILCVAARKLSASAPCNYGRLSQVNRPTLTGSVDEKLVAQFLSSLQKSSGMTTVAFTKAFKEIRRVVEARYKRGHSYTVFKGKWFGDVLHAELVASLPATALPSKDGLVHSIVQTANFSQAWSEHFRAPIREMAAFLNAPAQTK